MWFLSSSQLYLNIWLIVIWRRLIKINHVKGRSKYKQSFKPQWGITQLIPISPSFIYSLHASLLLMLFLDMHSSRRDISVMLHPSRESMHHIMWYSFENECFFQCEDIYIYILLTYPSCYFHGPSCLSCTSRLG